MRMIDKVFNNDAMDGIHHGPDALRYLVMNKLKVGRMIGVRSISL
jgi:hypothetical protein